MIELQNGIPTAKGIYLTYIKLHDYGFPYMRLSTWNNDKWSYTGSDQRVREESIACWIGPLPSPKEAAKFVDRIEEE
jgi:hypothetical protein